MCATTQKLWEDDLRSLDAAGVKRALAERGYSAVQIEGGGLSDGQLRDTLRQEFESLGTPYYLLVRKVACTIG